MFEVIESSRKELVKIGAVCVLDAYKPFVPTRGWRFYCCHNQKGQIVFIHENEEKQPVAVNIKMIEGEFTGYIFRAIPFMVINFL